jgi:chromosome segregation ATPase
LEEEKKMLEARYAEDLERLKHGFRATEVRAQDQIAMEREQALARAIIEKEKNLLESQNAKQGVHHEVRSLEERLQVAQAKIQALEQFSSDLQIKYDRLEARCFEKEAQLNELLSSDLPLKLVESKR